MDEKLCDLLQGADWKSLTPHLEHYADYLLRRYQWRGLPVDVGSNGQLLADGKSADDFVKDAIEALLEPDRRALNYDKPLEDNLKSIIESLIWNWKKKSDRKPLLDRRKVSSEHGEECDPISTAADPRSGAEMEAEKGERITAQKGLLNDFESSLKGDAELADLFAAYTLGITKNAHVEKETGLPAKRISELKRKMESKFIKFQKGHPAAKAAELERYL